ncbi:MAG: thioredoxin [Halobacteriota archaeon]
MSATTASEPIHVESESEFESLIESNPVVLVDYHADWCGPCKMLEPTVEEIAEEADVAVLKVDIDQLRALAQKQGIRSVPTLQFYSNGELADSVIGVQDKDNLLARLSNLE